MAAPLMFSFHPNDMKAPAHLTAGSPYDMKTRLWTWSQRAAAHTDTKSLPSANQRAGIQNLRIKALL